MQALEHHREQGRNYDVERLVRGTSAAAGRMLVALAWYYPELRSADERRWNFLVTAAGLYLTSQGTELTKTDQFDLPDHLARGMNSCRHFVAHAARDATDSLTRDWAVGCWVLSGLFRQEPRAEQVWMAASIGEALNRVSRAVATLTLLRPSATRARPAAVASGGTI
ncbi:MAG: hypothetical protein ACYSX0_20280 [Planctomycetota bacterium]|jgi:hypothetical protein